MSQQEIEVHQSDTMPEGKKQEPTITNPLRNLVSNTVSNILANKIVSLLTASGIVALAATWSYLVDKIGSPTIALLLIPITNKQIPITTLSLLFAIFYSFCVYRFSKWWLLKRQKYIFTSTCEFLWKTDISTKKTSNMPYCRYHKLEMIQGKEHFWCPSQPCKIGEDVSFTVKALFFLIAISKAKAKLDGHYKIKILKEIKSWLKYRAKLKPNKTINTDA